ncbi:2,3-butanediol dehydrogenase [Paracoccus sp. PS-1]|uniref:2,3-butanediol dehydrogenase n=1 Tax=unclassified Paracoccus (in: a-proteobacteria) TaxID=2688777 RepID=UPI00048E8763|nr:MULTISPECIES: 2,3-butanediol dehydrogenase [unclassified Paracoccus (in: a-proteobacteria)]MDQ7263206.1 2,3-butanediol dehydrogenase [Paracoccus sp. PS1]
MKALRFHAARDLRVEDIPEPPRPGPGQVLIRNRHVGICGTDLHEYASGPIFIPTAPHPYSGAHGPQVLGHEFGGEVLAVGEGVTKVAPGDRVAVQPLIMPRGGEHFADRGWHNLSGSLALVGLSWVSGGMAEMALLNDYNVEKIPDGMSDEEAALVEPTAVCVYACDRGRITAGDSVLVTGAGPIGILALLTARAFGATRLFVSDVNDTRLRLAAEVVPGVVAINPAREDVGERVRAGTQGGIGCDVALECVGNERALQSCLDAVRKQGVIVQTGLHPGKGSVDFFQLTFKDAEIRGSWCYPTHGWPRTIELIASGAIPARRVVTKRIALDEAVAEGFEALLDPAGSQLKILIDLSR